jgi:hypothetical protein
MNKGEPLTGRVAEIRSGSKYERLRAVLSMTPSRLRPFESRKNFARDYLYLLAKGDLLEHSGATALFAFQSASYRGFEIDAASYNGTVSVILFDAADRQFRIDLSQGRRGASLNQPEINRVIQSFASR